MLNCVFGGLRRSLLFYDVGNNEGFSGKRVEVGVVFSQAIGGEGEEAYQSRGVGAVDAEEGNRRLDFLGRGGIGAQAVESSSARDGELLSGGTEASAGKADGVHGDN
jgi:hypothetical protein